MVKCLYTYNNKFHLELISSLKALLLTLNYLTMTTMT